MIILDDMNKCTGCTACDSICPHNCITMVSNNKGFLYPIINQETCTECGLCHKICPENDIIEDKDEPPLFYAAKHNSDDIRLKSSSGGIFTALCEFIFSNNGVVFGVKFDEDFNVVHDIASNLEDISKFRGSKYVQSTKNDIFKKVKKELKTGKTVLFSGTPCEVAGLNKFLLKKYDNLLTCDFICHGVPSPGVWSDYINYLNSSNHPNKLVDFSFRNKEKSWRGMSVRKKYRDGSTSVVPILKDTFGYFFCANLLLRECCHDCSYANLNRPSDITIGDFWTIQKVSKEFEDTLGVSEILINTEKGKTVFNTISSNITSIEAKKEDSLQHPLVEPIPRNNESKKFWQTYQNKGFISVKTKFRLKFHTLKSILRTLKILPIIKKSKKWFQKR